MTPNIASTKVIIKNSILNGFINITYNNGTITKKDIDPRDTYLVTDIIVIVIIKGINIIAPNKVSSTPIDVATPFPPLKPIKTGQY